VSEDKGKEEEKSDFTPGGEGDISLGDARILAVRTAAESPGDYGRDFREVAMVFEVVESGEDGDHYNITLSFRPQGNFDGWRGEEQFLIGKDGTIAIRQVLSLPVRKGGGFPVIQVAIGLVVVGIIAAVGAVLALGSSGGESVPIASTISRAEAVFPSETPAPVVIPADTPEPTANIDATVEAGIQQGLEERQASVPVPTATRRSVPYTPTPTFTPTPRFTLTTQGYPSTGGTVMGGGVYIKGASATVSATPYKGYTFSGWSGACSGTVRCVVTINGHKTVTANFSLLPATPRPTATSSAWSYYDKGVEYQAAEDWVMSIGEYTTAIQVDPNYSDAYLYRGYSYYRLGQYQTAIKDYTKAIQLDPDNAYYHHNRGYTYLQSDQYQAAINDFTKTIQLEPDNSLAYQNRASGYYGSGSYQNAINDATKSIQLDPDRASVYQTRAGSYYMLGQYQAAITDYIKLTQLEPNNAIAHNWRGLSYRSLGQYALADADKTKACSLDSQYC